MCLLLQCLLVCCETTTRTAIVLTYFPHATGATSMRSRGLKKDIQTILDELSLTYETIPKAIWADPTIPFSWENSGMVVNLLIARIACHVCIAHRSMYECVLHAFLPQVGIHVNNHAHIFIRTCTCCYTYVYNSSYHTYVHMCVQPPLRRSFLSMLLSCAAVSAWPVWYRRCVETCMKT